MPALFDYLSTWYFHHVRELVGLVERFDFVAWQLLIKGLPGHNVINCGAETKRIVEITGIEW
jgi:hypothetical protein